MDIKQKLKDLECPFNWDMAMIDETIDTNYKPHDEEDLIPLLKLVRLLMDVFVLVQSKVCPKNSNDILSKLEDCDKAFEAVKADRPTQYSVKVVNHVLQAVKSFVYLKLDMNDRAEKMLEDVGTIDFSDKIEKSTVDGMRSMCWSKYHRHGSEKAVSFVRKALNNNPNCEIWYFILAKNLRRIRRDGTLGLKPNKEEIDCFSKAYELSKNVVYALFVAQCYRESSDGFRSYEGKINDQKALRVYNEVFTSINDKKYEGHRNTLYLRLALGFIQLRNFEKANKCLQQVALSSPQDTMYLHYKGMFHLKQKEFRQAAKYLKESASLGNPFAGRQYVRCEKMINPHFNFTEYLIDLLDQNKSLDDQTCQNLLLDVATGFMMKNCKEEAFKYFLKAIKINPESIALTKYHSAFEPGVSQNLYKVIENYLRWTQKVADEKTVSQLKAYCKSYFEKEDQLFQQGMSDLRL